MLRLHERGANQARADGEIELHMRPCQARRPTGGGEGRHRLADIMTVGPVEERAEREAGRPGISRGQRQPVEIQHHIVDIGQQ